MNIFDKSLQKTKTLSKACQYPVKHYIRGTSLAWSVEHATFDPKVVSSSPTLERALKKNYINCKSLYYTYKHRTLKRTQSLELGRCGFDFHLRHNEPYILRSYLASLNLFLHSVTYPGIRKKSMYVPETS